MSSVTEPAPTDPAGLTARLRRRPARPATSRRPTVSVIIPCYNYARFLPEAVGSVLTQVGVDADVVIVDDCSTDDSLAVARRLAQDAGDRITVIAHERNGGAVQTFNDGIPAVTGEYMVRLDADDLLTPGSLARATALLEAFPTVGLAYGRPAHFSGARPGSYPSRVRRWTVWPGRQWLADRTTDALNVITSPEAVMRSSLVREVGGQLPLKHSHDMEMWFRLAAFADVGYLEGPVQAWHREHGASLSTSNSGPLDDMIERREAFRALFEGAAAALPDADALLRRAELVIAEQALTSAAHTYDRRHADPELTEQYLDWAVATAPTVTGGRRWAGLQRRIALGPDGVAKRPWYVASARLRRVETLLRQRRWARHGTYTGR